jgi:hypothetical protein
MEGNILSIIQGKLKVPKSQYNSFGKYYYRSAEDIMESVKPFLVELGLSLVVSDDLVLIGERYYVCATSRLSQNGKVLAETTAYAREPTTQKGMDEAKITGSSSSYARKYSLQGLLLLSDEDDKDPDAQKPQDETENKTTSPAQGNGKPDVFTNDQMKRIRAMISDKEMSSKEKEQCYQWVKSNRAKTIEIDGKNVITKESANDLIDNMNRYISDWIETKFENNNFSNDEPPF